MRCRARAARWFYSASMVTASPEIVEGGVRVLAERLRVDPPHPKRDLIIISEKASRHWSRFAQQ